MAFSDLGSPFGAGLENSLRLASVTAASNVCSACALEAPLLTFENRPEDDSRGAITGAADDDERGAMIGITVDELFTVRPVFTSAEDLSATGNLGNSGFTLIDPGGP